jgi:hypothetical protein
MVERYGFGQSDPGRGVLLPALRSLALSGLKGGLIHGNQR